MPCISGSGVYVIAVTSAEVLPVISAGRSGAIYVGMTEHSLDVRNHFHRTHSGFSTLRRSLGALLKEQLGLIAIPRAPGPSRSNTINYRFSDDGERVLSSWMADNLLVAQQRLTSDVSAIERELIAVLEPPLNLTGWANPYRQTLKDLRAECAWEARCASRVERV